MSDFRNVDLPEKLAKRLPPPALETYREAFHNAWNSYRHAQKEGNLSLRDLAHRVAMASLEGRFHKTARGRWVAD